MAKQRAKAYTATVVVNLKAKDEDEARDVARYVANRAADALGVIVAHVEQVELDPEEA